MKIPTQHQQFLDGVLPRLQQHPGVVGVAVTGSIAGGHPDEYSDVDLIVLIADDDFEAVMTQRLELIDSWTDLVAGFTGEHVGEPRLIITLVGPPLLHVDFKFVRVSDFADRVEDPMILWDRDNVLAGRLEQRPATEPSLDLQWIEDRFWIWVHYGATKLARGELFEVISFLTYLRDTVLGPLAAQRVGAPQRGVRHLESRAPAGAGELEATVCGYDRSEAAAALLATVAIYRRWRDESGTTLTRNERVESLAAQYLQAVIDHPPAS